jgi:hypothetical protein
MEFPKGADQNIGDFFLGVSFSPIVTALSVSRFGGCDSPAFPPHSAKVVVWDQVDPIITIGFSTPFDSSEFGTPRSIR